MLYMNCIGIYVCCICTILFLYTVCILYMYATYIYCICILYMYNIYVLYCICIYSVCNVIAVGYAYYILK